MLAGLLLNGKQSVTYTQSSAMDTNNKVDSLQFHRLNDDWRIFSSPVNDGLVF